MPKYIRRSRSTASSNANSLRDALLNDLEKEGEKLLKRMTSQFTRDLEKEGARVFQSLLSRDVGGARGSGGNAVPVGLEAATSLIGTLVGYALSRPRTSSSTRESDRSRDTEKQFRVSRAQAMAEATAELSRSDRNT